MSSQTNSRSGGTDSSPRLLPLSAGRAPLLLKAGIDQFAAAPNETVSRKNAVDEDSEDAPMNSPAESNVVTVVASAESEVKPATSPDRRCCARCHKSSGLRRTETHCPRCRLVIRLGELHISGELSPLMWERLRRIFCLPKKPNQLLPDKARVVRRMLDSFVERVPTAEQFALTEAELLARIIELPGLPATFTKTGRGTSNAGSAHGGKVSNSVSGNNPSDNDDDARGEMICGEKETAAAKGEREPVSAALFRKVVARQGLHCWWCGTPVVRESQIPLSKRMLRGRQTLLYHARGELREEACATIDHLRRVGDGGDNRPENLVISCYPCNRERELITAAYRRPFAQRRTPCHVCGGRFFHPDWGCCSVCGAASERANGVLSWYGRVARAVGKLMARLTAG